MKAALHLQNGALPRRVTTLTTSTTHNTTQRSRHPDTAYEGIWAGDSHCLVAGNGSCGRVAAARIREWASGAKGGGSCLAQQLQCNEWRACIQQLPAA